MEIKKYQVIMQDEYNNLYHIGFYDKLSDALPDVNDWLSIYNTKIDEIEEYPSTYSNCFDKDIEIEDEEIVVYLRGFIF